MPDGDGAGADWPAPPAEYDAALGLVASGVTLVTVADGREDVGVTVSAFCAVSREPALILISLIGDSYPAELLTRLDQFAVTLLGSGQRMLAGRFAASGRPGARLLLDDVPHHRGSISGALIPDGGLAALECAAVRRVPAGDHLLVIAHVLFVAYVKEAGDPLIRFGGRYPALARG
ncbi:MAG TPA: flavin reductase family protein [Streptosporangiaceae bacterium]|jgi:flavin reductase (DIM6/NTAB) family NADH-FMN oxidoreductase RutF|nr:flavin reductase family protein [Streptosporangiaceae bacterium]